MRRNTARNYWDVESDHRSDREHNGLTSPPSPQAGDHLRGSDLDSRGKKRSNSNSSSSNNKNNVNIMNNNNNNSSSNNNNNSNNNGKDNMFRESDPEGGVGADGDGALLLTGGTESERELSGSSGGSVSGCAFKKGGGDGSQRQHQEIGATSGSAGPGRGLHYHVGGGGVGGGASVAGGGSTSSERKRYGGGGRDRQRRIFLRIHKFVFQKELAMHFSICILSIAIPFSLSGSPWLAAIPLSVWCFYNAMFVIGAKRAGAVLPGFDRFKRSFVAAMEEFLPPRLVPVLSLSFLSVLIAITLTAARLGGPPLCLSSCHACLRSWKHAHPISPLADPPSPAMRFSITSPRGGGTPKMDGVLPGAVRTHGWAAQDEVSENGVADFGMSRRDERGAATATHRMLFATKGVACGYANGKVRFLPRGSGAYQRLAVGRAKFFFTECCRQGSPWLFFCAGPTCCGLDYALPHSISKFIMFAVCVAPPY